MDKHETLKHRGYLKILGGNQSQENKIQAELACPSTILWVDFCGLVHVHGMHQLEVWVAEHPLRHTAGCVLTKETCGEVINKMEPFNWEFAACIRK